MGEATRSRIARDYLSKILREFGGSASARELWQRSELGIDEFYKALREEISSDRISESCDKERLELSDAA